jgi:hypothetical protein
MTDEWTQEQLQSHAFEKGLVVTARDELVQWFADRRVGGVALVASPEDYETAEALHAAGWRKMPSRENVIDRLRAAEHAPMYDHDERDGSCRSCPWPLHMLAPEDIADAILALMDGDNE